jgi:hypothetical protein
MTCRKCALTVLTELYDVMSDLYAGKTNPLKNVETLEQVACMQSIFTLQVYHSLAQLKEQDQLYVLKILSTIDLR